MKSLWDDQKAAALADDPLALRVYTSRLLGGDPALVLHGGGNTSVKAKVKNFFGDEETVLYVKGSGWDLGTIEAPGFAPVRLNVPLRLAEMPTLSDTDMVKNLRGAMLDPGAPTPSVETILHAIIPFKFVDHSHADAVVTAMNTADGADRMRDLYGPNMLLVPYVMPGFILARTVYEMTRDIDWSKLDGILLMNHGVFTFADDAKSSYERHIAIVTQAEEYLAQRVKVQPAAQTEIKENLVDLARLRRAVSKARGGATLALRNAGAEAVAFANLPNIADVATRGLLTPDHVLRTKRLPLIGRDVAAYAEAYRHYFQDMSQQAREPKTMLDPAPRVVLDPELGLCTAGRSAREAAIVRDIYEHTIDIILAGEALGGYRALPAKDIFDVEYWDLEQAKLKRGGKPAAFAGEVALVTGAASGIGKACVESLLARGAAVVGGAREIKVDLELLQDELPALVDVLKRLFEGAPDKLTLEKPAKKSARPKKAEAAEPALPASSPALALVRLLTEKKLIELDEGVRPESVAKRIAPLLRLLPEKRAKKETVAFLFDDDEIAEVYADEDLLYAVVREFLG